MVQIMRTLSIQIPDELQRQAELRATEAGHASLEQYVTALIQSDAEGMEDFGAPPGVQYDSDDELEAELARRMEEGGPSIEITQEYWDRLRARVQDAGMP